MSQLKHSERSGAPIEPDKPTTVTYEFEDGERRAVEVTAAEAGDLSKQGVPMTPVNGARRFVRRHWKSVLKWVAIAYVGGSLGQLISDEYSDQQRELELESSLITRISDGTIELYQEAQNAARAPTPGERSEQGNKAADKWVLASASITPLFQVYFKDDEVLASWDEYQKAMYEWAALGCCTPAADRPARVAEIRKYAGDAIGPPTTEPPVEDPWGPLASAEPPGPVYRWVGQYLVRGRGVILDELEETRPNLDTRPWWSVPFLPFR